MRANAARKTPTVHFTLRLPRDVMNALRREARATKATIAQVIVAALNRRIMEAKQVSEPGGIIVQPISAPPRPAEESDLYSIKDH